MANIVDILLKVKDDASKDLGSFEDRLKRIRKIGGLTFKDFDKLSLKQAGERLGFFGDQIQDFLVRDWNDLKRNMEKSGEIGKLVARNLGGLSFAAAGAAVKAYSKAAITATDKLADLGNTLRNVSQITGQSIETIQALELAAQRSTIPIESVRDALSTLSQEIGKASIGNKQAIEKFKNLGISVKDMSGNIKSAEQILNELSDSLNQTKNPAQRAALATDLLGEQARKVLPILAGGSNQLAQFTNELNSFSGAITEKTLEQLDEFQDIQNAVAESNRELEVSYVNVGLAAAKTTGILTIGLNEYKKDFNLFVSAGIDGFTKLLGLGDETVENLNRQAAAAKARNESLKKQRDIQIEKQAKEKKRIASLQKEQEKYNESLDKMREKIEADIKTTGLDNVSKALQKNDNWLNKIIQKYGTDLPEAFELYERKNAEIHRKQSDRLASVNQDIDDQIAKLKLSDRELAQRDVDTQIADITRRAAEAGPISEDTATKIAELQKLKQQELADSFRDTNEEISKTVEKVREVEPEIRELSESIESVGESATKTEGNLGQMLAGMDAIGARAFEFMGAGQRNTGASAFGTAGTANDVESLLRVADRARAESLREQINLARSGQIQVDTSQLDRWIQEFEKISTDLGGLGSVGTGTGRAGALLGDRKVTIEFNPTQDFDNMSAASQRQLAEGIANAIQ